MKLVAIGKSVFVNFETYKQDSLHYYYEIDLKSCSVTVGRVVSDTLSCIMLVDNTAS